MTILIVEDNADILAALVRLLKRRGHRALAAASCAEARRLFDESVDVCVIDISLGDGDGRDLLRELRAVSPVTAISISAYANVENEPRSKEAGFVAHLSKPFKLEELVGAIEGAAG